MESWAADALPAPYAMIGTAGAAGSDTAVVVPIDPMYFAQYEALVRARRRRVAALASVLPPSASLSALLAAYGVQLEGGSPPAMQHDSCYNQVTCHHVKHGSRAFCPLQLHNVCE